MPSKNRAGRTALALAAVFLLAGQARAVEESGPSAPVKKMEKNSAKECALCHISWIDVFFFDGKATELTDRPPLESTSSEEMCFSCHNGSLGDSRERVWGKRKHPINVKPSAGYVIPKELPLDKDGRIICASCHSAHSISDATRFDQVIFLRTENKNSELCLLCHKDRVGGSRVGNHPLLVRVDEEVRRRVERLGGRFGAGGGLICESCHAAHGAGADRMLIVPDQAEDGTSVLCEVCHGASPGRVDKKGGLLSHPIDRVPTVIKVPGAWATGERVRVGAGGKLVCGTCHRTHNAARGTRLLVRPGGEGFCLECHKEMARVVGTSHDLNIVGSEDVNVLGEDVKRSGVCGACHLVHQAAGERLWARDLPAVEGVDAVTRLCLSCHREGGVAARKPVSVPLHSVGRPEPAGMDVGGLPLYGPDGSRGGKMVSCATCHEVHQWDPANPGNRPGKKVEGGPTTSFLRIPDSAGSTLCLRCHREKETVLKTGHDAAVVPEIRQGRGETSLCGACHLVHGAKGNRLWATEVPAREGADRVSTLCLSCHGEGGMAGGKQPVGLNGHPVGRQVPAGMDIGNLPLYGLDGALRGRNLSCATCHDVHRWDPANAANRPGKRGRGDAATSFLRFPDSAGSALCLRCHQEKETVAKTDHDAGVVPELRGGQGTSTLCGACHLVHGAKGNRLWATEVPAREGIDRVSALCLSCHGSGGMAGGKQPIDRNGHPVGTAAPGGMDVGNLPLYGLDGELRGQNLSCATCHDVHRWDPKNAANRPGKKVTGDAANRFLRSPDGADSALCLRCHRDKETVGKTPHDPAVIPALRQGKGETSLCAGCHLVHGAKGDLLWVREVTAKEGLDLVSALCLSCHSEGGAAGDKVTGANGHPVGKVVPETMDTGGLPLFAMAGVDKGKNLSCATCHDAHRWDPANAANRPGKKVEGDAVTSFLRKASNQDAPLCVVCHPDQRWVVGTKHDLRTGLPGKAPAPGLAAAVSAKGVCASCHQVHNAQQDRLLWAGKPEEVPLADPVWPFCRSCHRKEGLAEKKFIKTPLHPVGVPWEGKKIPLPLFAGKASRERKLVTCATCHDPHRFRPGSEQPAGGSNVEGTGDDSFLRVPSTGAENICGICHVKQAGVVDTYHDRKRMTALYGPPTAQDSQRGVCEVCHSVHAPSRELLLWTGPAGEGGDTMMNFCTGCHRDVKLVQNKDVFFPAHPQNVLISNRSGKFRGLEADFQIYEKDGRKNISGILTCPTCHDPHRWDSADPSLKPAEGEEGSAINDFLRNKGATFGFCSDCHGFQAILFYKNYHDPREWKRKGGQ